MLSIELALAFVPCKVSPRTFCSQPGQRHGVGPVLATPNKDHTSGKTVTHCCTQFTDVLRVVHGENLKVVFFWRNRILFPFGLAQDPQGKKPVEEKN